MGHGEPHERFLAPLPPPGSWNGPRPGGYNSSGPRNFNNGGSGSMGGGYRGPRRDDAVVPVSFSPAHAPIPLPTRNVSLPSPPANQDNGEFIDRNAPGFRDVPFKKGARGRDADQGPQVVMNYRIKFPEVRVIAEDKSPIGIMPIDDALKMAQESEQDLILINEDAQPPVCRCGSPASPPESLRACQKPQAPIPPRSSRLIEYTKFKFEKEKQEKEARKKMRDARVDLHELKLRPNIDVHDYDVKLRKAEEFLVKDGDKVKVVVPMRGRELIFKANGEQLMQRFIQDLGDKAMVESPPKLQGRDFLMILAPAKPGANKAKAPRPPRPAAAAADSDGAQEDKAEAEVAPEEQAPAAPTA